MNDTVRFVTNKISELSDEDLGHAKDFLAINFCDDPEYIYSIYRGSEWDSALFMYDRNRLVGHAAIVKEIIKHHGKKYTVGRVKDLVIHKKYRGKGFGRKLMDEVNKVLEENGYDLGLIFCDPELSKFYDSCKWFKNKHSDEAQDAIYFYPVKLSDEDIVNWSKKEVTL